VGDQVRLNVPMVARLRECAADTSANWDGKINIYPPEARELVALIDAAGMGAKRGACATCGRAGLLLTRQGNKAVRFARIALCLQVVALVLWVVAFLLARAGS